MGVKDERWEGQHLLPLMFSHPVYIFFTCSQAYQLIFPLLLLSAYPTYLCKSILQTPPLLIAYLTPFMPSHPVDRSMVNVYPTHHCQEILYSPSPHVPRPTRWSPSLYLYSLFWPMVIQFNQCQAFRCTPSPCFLGVQTGLLSSTSALSSSQCLFSSTNAKSSTAHLLHVSCVCKLVSFPPLFS